MWEIWRDVLELPESLQRTLDAGDGFADTAAFVSGRAVRRLVVTGNGAAYYVAHALWLVSLESDSALAVEAIPAGLIAAGRVRWRRGDALLVISTSGELRDLVEPLRAGTALPPYAAITASPHSTIAAGAAARALVTVCNQRAVTHTQAYCGNVLAALAIWAAITNDRSLHRSVAAAPSLCLAAIEAAQEWSAAAAADPTPHAAVAFGAGAGWAAALETALLLKELAQIPSEGLEAREGATSAMTGLSRGCLVVGLHPRTNDVVAEAEELCRHTGATIVSLDQGETADRRLTPITTFPASVALATAHGEQRGIDIDSPPWTSAYYKTARAVDEATQADAGT